MTEETAPITPEVEVEATTVDPILASLSDDDSAEVATSEEKVDESPEDNLEDVKEDEPVQPDATPEAEQEDIDPKEEARRRYEERQTLKAEENARITEQTQPYVDQAEDDTDRRLRAMEVESYKQLVNSTNETLVNEFERAKANPDLQIFNPDSEQFNQKIYDKAMRDYNAGYVQYDDNGNRVGIKGSLYQHLTETAELYQGATKQGAFQQVRDQRKMKTNADSKQAVSPKEDTKDPILEVLMSD